MRALIKKHDADEMWSFFISKERGWNTPHNLAYVCGVNPGTVKRSKFIKQVLDFLRAHTKSDGTPHPLVAEGNGANGLRSLSSV